MLLGRYLVGVWLAMSASFVAAVPQLHLSQSAAVVNLADAMVTELLPADVPPDPDRFWSRPLPAAGVEVGGQWNARAGKRLMGRITLQGSREKDQFVVLVPSSRIDEVQLWYRQVEGGGWKGAVAGDRIALSRWPFVGPFPAFALPLGEKPVELIVTAANDGYLPVPVLIMPDAMYRQVQTKQAEVSGLVIGIGLMGVVVCLISAITLRRRASWLLVLVAAWALFFILCLNGDMAIWFTPEWPGFNDASKHLASVVLSALVFAMMAQALDVRLFGHSLHWFSVAAVAVAAVYAVVQILWLPPAWRPAGALSWALLTVAFGLALCGISALGGGRYTRRVAAAGLCYVGSVGVVLLDPVLVFALDLRMAASAGLLCACVLSIRHALFLRERYGRDVLSRAAISANRDPLTALLSYSGFQHAYDEALLRQGQQPDGVWIILFLLPGLERSSLDYGFVLTERALVRFAACLQSVLGDQWCIGRLSKTRFACLPLQAADKEDVQALATQVLAGGARMSDPVAPVTELDLRIACVRCHPNPASLTGVLQQLEDAARALDGQKRITIL